MIYTRGLEIRANFAAAMLACAVHEECGAKPLDHAHPFQVYEDAASDSIQDATAMGFHEYQNNELDPPVLFGDIPALLQAWKEGQATGAELVAMQNCPDCQNPRLAICPCHG